MEVISNLIIILISASVLIGVIVGIHELGHFLAARFFGVKVLKFKIGFGKTLYSRLDSSGTEFSLGLIPMGGYVQMLGEPGYKEEGVSSNSKNNNSFPDASAGARAVICAAGPFANLLLAVFLYTIIFMIGTKDLSPIVGGVEPESLAEKIGLDIGDKIISVDDKEILNFSDLNLALISRSGESGEIKISYQQRNSDFKETTYLQINNFLQKIGEQSPLNFFGISPFIPPIISSVLPDGPADLAGLKEGDEIISINGKSIKTWAQLVKAVDDYQGETVLLDFARGSSNFSSSILLESVLQESGDNLGVKITKGRLGISRISRIDEFPKYLVASQKFSFFSSIFQATAKVYSLSVLIIDSIKKMFSGSVSAENIGGPIQISLIAGSAAKAGFFAFFNLMAFISINLGLINLLPIPILDGGQLLLIGIERIKGSPISEKYLEYGLRFSLVFLVSLMVFAVFNDVMRII